MWNTGTAGSGFDEHAQTLRDQCRNTVHTFRVLIGPLNHRIHLLLIFDSCQFPCYYPEFTDLLSLLIYVFSTRNLHNQVDKFQVIFLPKWTPNGLTEYLVGKEVTSIGIGAICTAITVKLQHIISYNRDECEILFQ